MADRFDYPKRRPAWIRYLIWLFVIALTVWGGIAILTQRSISRWEGLLAELRDANEPVTFEEIEAARSKIPDETNSALVFDRLKDVPDELMSKQTGEVLALGAQAPDVDFFQGIPRYAVEPTRAFVRKRADIIEKLTRLRDLPTGRMALPDVPNRIAIRLPKLCCCRAVSELVHLSAVMALLDGSTDSAAAETMLEFHLAGALDEHPTVLGSLVQAAIDTRALHDLESTLRVGELSVVKLEQLGRAIERRREVPRMLWALRGERAFFAEACECICTGHYGRLPVTPGQSLPPMPTRWLRTLLMRTNQRAGVEMLTRLVNVADNPGSLMKAATALQAEIQQLPRYKIFVQKLVPDLTRATVVHARILSKLDCARVALAAERFRLRTGRLPDSIDRLVPQDLGAVPIDLFDGKPMRFAVTPEGIVIYSISEDLTDDGGSVAVREGEKRPRDVGFRLFKLEHRGLLLTDEEPPRDD